MDKTRYFKTENVINHGIMVSEAFCDLANQLTGNCRTFEKKKSNPICFKIYLNLCTVFIDKSYKCNLFIEFNTD